MNKKMNAVIVSCSSLTEFVDLAQRNMGTSYPVVIVDRQYHSEPSEMKERIRETIQGLPAEYDTVLVSMGFCGGTWDHVTFDRRIVIPRVDDCVSLLLTRDNVLVPNRKEMGHLYLYETNPEDFSALSLMREGFQSGDRDLDGLDPAYLFSMLTQGYHHMDIIDTGLSPCYEEDYVIKAQEQADVIGAELDYVPGGVLLLEKLVSGDWDEQFIVAEPGTVLRHGLFFE